MGTYKFLATVCGLAAASIPVASAAQNHEDAARRDVGAAPAADGASTDGSLLSEIIVTATKKNRGEEAQSVPIALTAVSASQIETLHMRTLRDLGTIAPNVQLEPNGAIKGVANFVIRGLGANTITASVEPAVGTFVNGIYVGVLGGVLVDSFDLEGVEILRGPQGTLFGRNVTGGAVLLRTARPTKELTGQIKASIETGPEYSVAATVGGPVIGSAVLFKLTGYYKRDDGWFFNETTGRPFGKEDTWFVRPTLVARLGDALEQTVIYEHLSSTGDGIAVRNLFLNPNNFQVTINAPTATRTISNSLTSETNLSVSLGDGMITNLFGYRDLVQGNRRDTDSSPLTINHSQDILRQHQLSNELRYAGNFSDIWDITVGGYYFTQKIKFLEARLLGLPLAPTGTTTAGGGIQDQSGYAFFTQSDIRLSPTITATLGARFSHETKEAHIARVSVAKPCDFVTEICNFTGADAVNGKRSWSAFTPKIGLRVQATPNAMVFATFSKGVRSGGYNIRRTAIIDPGTFDQEKLDSYEVGLKSDLLGRRLRANFTAYYTTIRNMQRDANVAVSGSPISVLFNAANAEIYGAEAELIVSPTRGLVLSANAGLTEGRYTRIFADLNGDGMITAADSALGIPRLAKLTYNLGINYEFGLEGGAKVDLQANFGYRQRVPQNEANTEFFNAYQRLNANITVTLPNNAFSFSGYVRNLTNREQNNAAVRLIPGLSYFNTIDEGRSYGVEARYRF